MTTSVNLCQIFTDMLDSITDAFCYLDNNWRLIYINPAAEKILMTPKEQFLNKKVWEVFNQNWGNVLLVADRIIETMQQPFNLNGKKFGVTAS